MANNANYVSAGKPRPAGAVYRAAAGTTAPTDATTALAADFKALGYCSDDGMSNDNSPSVTIINAWGGDPVLTIQESREDTFTVTLIETMNVDVLKAVYGEDNVTGTLETGITVQANNQDLEEGVWVIDMILNGGVLQRTVIPKGKITEIGTIEYSDSDAIGFEVTITGIRDANGQTHYDYIKAA